MACSKRCKNFICFLAVLAQVLTLTGSSQARSLLHLNVPGFQAQNSSHAATLRNLAAMLPKGAPLPPSGPSPAIN
ncbi:hypothetical protein NC653_031624 [Populus alba x Populus x berolinensis]|uniref:Uncharacterized protein n=1 Tax=Populus alba x Populus x berolinensis TaxID=444605 RepID=A0AAD6LZ79_9ROSI|nr:hypothetical protein NC653_031624 [Populus alba x Populus x berolinensis]